MVKQGKNDGELLGLVVKLQEQISSLDKKVDILMGRMMATPSLMANAPKAPEKTQPQQSKEKVMYKIICVDCGKESSLPFKPNPDRPVYCKECFAERRKGNGPIRAESHRPNIAPTMAPRVEPKAEVKAVTKGSQPKPKKKAPVVRKPAIKKKVTKKKK